MPYPVLARKTLTRNFCPVYGECEINSVCPDPGVETGYTKKECTDGLLDATPATDSGV